MRKALAAMSILLLAGCVYPGFQQRQAYLAQFVGASEADVVRALGVPSRTIDTGGQHFLAYTERRTDVLPGYGGYGGFGYYGGYYGAPVFANAPQVIERTCETTFELEAGRVKAFSLRGNACY